MPQRSKKEIEELIFKTGYKNFELAPILGVSENTISRWKSQKAVPELTWKKLEELAENPKKNDVRLSSFSNEVLIGELRRRLGQLNSKKKKSTKSSSRSGARQ